jgi:integrase/recombinase XerD
MKEYKNYLIERGNSFESIRTKECHVQQLLNWSKKEGIEIQNCSYQNMMAYIEAIKARNIQQSTLRLMLSHYKDYFTYLVKSGERTDHPIAHLKIQGVKKNHLYRILEEAELAKIYQEYESAAPDRKTIRMNYIQIKFSRKRNKCMIGMMVYQGLTNGELSRIRMEDMNLREGKIYIRTSRKSAERTLKLETEQLFELMEYVKEHREEMLEHQKRDSDQLFFSIQGGNLYVAVTRMMRKLRKQHPKLSSTKQIRASVITNWLKHHNLRRVQYMAGHKVITTTEQYLVNDITSLQEDINLFNPF